MTIFKGLVVFYVISWLCYRFHYRKPKADPPKKSARERGEEAGLRLLKGGKK